MKMFITPIGACLKIYHGNYEISIAFERGPGNVDWLGKTELCIYHGNTNITRDVMGEAHQYGLYMVDWNDVNKVISAIDEYNAS